LRRSSPMAIRTHDLALGDLVQHRLPATLIDPSRDAELLVAQMIELEDERIALPAVDAVSLAKEIDEVCVAPGDKRAFAAHRAGDISVFVPFVVLVQVRRSTLPTQIVSLLTTSARSELGNRFACATARAAAARGRLRHADEPGWRCVDEMRQPVQPRARTRPVWQCVADDSSHTRPRTSRSR
jgi:hypothetical protein